MEYYEQKNDYYRAGILLEDLVPIIKGTPEAEKAQFYWAYCYYKQRQYSLSSHYFKTFHDTYNRSPFAEEALFMYAYSLFMDSPPLHLDQGSTQTAINALQDFINRYPSSNYARQSAGIILELRAKLEDKAYRNARLYQQLGRYKSAVIAYENFKRDYPDSRYQEECAFRQLEAQYDYARNSYQDKRKERYLETVTFYQTFVDKYPQSSFLKQAEGMFDNSQRQLKAIASIEKNAAQELQANRQ
jgi:outer membrane protein assembly factor BamD